MSKSDEAFEQWWGEGEPTMRTSEKDAASDAWTAACAYKEEQSLAAVEAFKQICKFSATPYIRGESLCDEIARRIKES